MSSVQFREAADTFLLQRCSRFFYGKKLGVFSLLPISQPMLKEIFLDIFLAIEPSKIYYAHSSWVWGGYHLGMLIPEERVVHISSCQFGPYLHYIFLG